MTATKAQPYRVTSSTGAMPLMIMNNTDQLPLAFGLMGTRAERKVAVRILGGCSNMTAVDKERMVEFFVEGFSGYKGVIFSGGTRNVRDGELDPMVTDVPGFVADENPGCIALGTTPRTSMLRLVGDSRLMFDDDNAPNPGLHGLLIVQNGPDGEAGWDEDLPIYHGIMNQWRSHAGFTALATVAWNGGGVTKKEINKSALSGWPTILVRGSGRACDEYIKAFDAGDNPIDGLKDANNVIIVSKDEPAQLARALRDAGVL